MTARPTLRRTAPLAVAALAVALLAGCSGDSDADSDSGNKPDSERASTQPGFVQTNLVANWEAYNPQIVEPELENAWGISLRPAGAGGHFWITAQASGKS